MNLICNDIARCAGRFGLGPDDPICERRNECARHQQMAIDRKRFPDGCPEFIPVHTGLCSPHEHDYLIPLEVSDGQ